MTVLGILLALAIPNFEGLWSSYVKSNAFRELQADVRRMRAETLMAGTRGVMTIDLDGSGYAFGFDELPYASPPAIDRTVFRTKLPNQIALSSSQDLYFDSKGLVIDSSGSVTSLNMDLDFRGNTYASATIYATGAFDLN